VLSGGAPGRHGIQGLADGFVPALVDRGQIDGVLVVSTEEAIATARRLHREEGLLVGISAGANVAACKRLAARLPRGARIVTVLADRGERYLSVWS
jgi:cysteine synthase A